MYFNINRKTKTQNTNKCSESEQDMREDKKIELKNLFNSINMPEFSDDLDEVLTNYLEYIPYFRDLWNDAKQTRDTTSGDTFLMYRHRAEALKDIIEIMMIFS